MLYVVEFFHLVRDVVRAIVFTLVGKRRVAYFGRATVRAPREAVWRLIDGDDVTFEAAGLNVRTEPLAGVPDGYAGQLSVHGKPVTSLAYQKLRLEPHALHVSRYLPEHSGMPEQFGDDDIITVALEDGPKGTTRIGFMRELTHRSFSTRITAPIGVRQGAWMVKTQAEADAGLAAPTVSSGAWRQTGMALAAFASFTLIAGWKDALLLMVIIAVHEGGHVLAMLRYRLGVAFVGFVPFLGGMAAPARAYDSDWQHGIVMAMGVGVSLPVALVLYWLADVNASPEIAHAAVLFAVINGANLLPLPGLDGGMIVRLLSHRVHPMLAHVVMWSMMAAFVALAVWLGSVWVWIAVAFGFLQLVVLSSFKPVASRVPLSWGGAGLLAGLYVALFAAYVAASMAAFKLGVGLERERSRALRSAALVVSSGDAKSGESPIVIVARTHRPS